MKQEKKFFFPPVFFAVSKHSKFGVIADDFQETLSILSGCPRIRITGLHCHLGSTITDVSIYSQMFGRIEQVLAEFKDSLKDAHLINIGGGLGINYHHEKSKVKKNTATRKICKANSYHFFFQDAPPISGLNQALPPRTKFTIMVEPGRSLVGNTGILLIKVGEKKSFWY